MIITMPDVVKAGFPVVVVAGEEDVVGVIRLPVRVGGKVRIEDSHFAIRIIHVPLEGISTRVRERSFSSQQMANSKSVDGHRGEHFACSCPSRMDAFTRNHLSEFA
jgi:hypothetical protein